MRASLFRRSHLLLACAAVFSFAHVARAQPQPAQPGAADVRPLSPAQVALFATPHLSNVTHPETLRYTYRQAGAAPFTDTISVHVKAINSDGSKELAFDYLTGAHHVFFPALDHFRGNPLLMLALEQDVAMMKTALGMSEAYFRNRIREAFLDGATVSDTTVAFESKAAPARALTIKPFAHEQRLERIPSLQAKTYTFTLADAVPGMIASIRFDTPEDPALHAPAFSQQITFTGVDP